MKEILLQCYRTYLTLKNFQKHHLNFAVKELDTANTQVDWLLTIPKESKLTMLTFRMTGVEEKSIPDLVRILLSLNKLQYLNISDGNLLTDNQKDHLLLLESLKQLKKLKSITLSGERKTRPTKASNKGRIEDPATTKLRNKIKELFDSNPSLEKIWMNAPSDEIRYFRY